MSLIRTGIAGRFSKAIALQLLLVALAAVLGTWGAGWIMKEMLVRQALTTEADYYWKQKLKDNSFALPDTRNLTGFSSDLPNMPEDFSGLAP